MKALLYVAFGAIAMIVTLVFCAVAFMLFHSLPEVILAGVASLFATLPLNIWLDRKVGS